MNRYEQSKSQQLTPEAAKPSHLGQPTREFSVQGEGQSYAPGTFTASYSNPSHNTIQLGTDDTPKEEAVIDIATSSGVRHEAAQPILTSPLSPAVLGTTQATATDDLPQETQGWYQQRMMRDVGEMFVEFGNTIKSFVIGGFASTEGMAELGVPIAGMAGAIAGTVGSMTNVYAKLEIRELMGEVEPHNATDIRSLYELAQFFIDAGAAVMVWVSEWAHIYGAEEWAQWAATWANLLLAANDARALLPKFITIAKKTRSFNTFRVAVVEEIGIDDVIKLIRIASVIGASLGLPLASFGVAAASFLAFVRSIWTGGRTSQTR